MDVLANKYHGKDSKITSTALNEELLKIKAIRSENDVCSVYDGLIILQSLLLKQFAPERINGVINLFCTLFDCGTQDDIENALVRCHT